MAKAAIEKNDYLCLEFRNKIFLNMTPFPLYPMMASFKLFGISEVTARLSSALFGLGIIFQIFIIARRYYGQMTALLAVLITITITQFIFYHGLKSANIDSITLFFLTGTLSCWVLIKRQDYRIIFTLLSLAFAFLCKGPIIAIPLIVIGLSFLVENPIKRTSLKPLLIGIFVAAVIVLPWYIYAYKVYGDIFVKNYIMYNFLQRFTEGIEDHKYGALYFIKYLLSTRNFIWIGAAMVSIVYFIKIFLKEKRLIEFILPAWVFVTFIIVNLSQTKLWWYIYPIYPPLAVMTAKTLMDFVERNDRLNTTAYCLGLILIAIPDFSRLLFLYKYPFKKAIVIAIAIAFSLTLLISFVKKCLLKYGKGFSVLLIFALSFIPVYRTVKLTMPKNTTPPILSVVEHLDLRKPVYTYEVYPSGIYYLSKIASVREYYEYYSPEELRNLKGKLVVMGTETLNKIKPKDSDGMFVAKFQGESYLVTPIKNAGEFSVVRVE